MLKKLKEFFFGKPVEPISVEKPSLMPAQSESANNQITDSVTAQKPKRNRKPRKKPASQTTQPTKKQVPAIKASNSAASAKPRRKKNTNTTQK